MKGMYFCELSMPAGLLREWLCRVLARDGGCDCEYCDAFVGIGCPDMVGTVVGAVYADDVTGRDEAPPGCRAPGNPLEELAFEGRMLAN